MEESIKIVIVDDDGNSLRTDARILKSAGYEVIQVHTGTDALQRIKENHPDLVLLDAELPDMNVTDMCRQIKSDRDLTVIHIILVSSLPKTSRQLTETLEEAADGYIVRPVERGEFLARIKAAERIIKTEKALRISEAKLKRAQRIGHLGYWEWDIQAGTVIWSDETYRIWGLEPQEHEINPERVLNLIHPGDRDAVVIAFSDALNGVRPYNLEYRVLRKDGGIGFVRSVAEVSRTREGTPLHIYGTVLDITERTHTEDALRESEEKYRQYFKNITDVIFTIDADFRISDISPGVEKLLGYTPEELIGRAIFDVSMIFTPESFKRALSEGVQILAGEKLHRSSFDFVARDGSVKNLELRGSPLVHEGTIVGMVAVARDITERTRVEQALLASEARFRALIEKSMEMIFLLNSDGTVNYVSPSVKPIMGFTPEELAGRNIFELLHPDDLARVMTEMHTAIQATGDAANMTQARVRHADGSWHIHEGIGTNLLDDPDVAGFVMNSRDITERTLADEALEKSFANLRRAMGATIQAMSLAVETRDPYTAGHQRRVADLARTIASKMGLTKDQIDAIRMASTIHDLGKIAVPAEILSKPMKLSASEFGLIKTHAQVGHDILKDIEFPWPIARMVLEHHERIDGSGYPHGLKGEEILLESRLIAVADVVEAIASHRPYRPAYSLEVALGEIREHRGLLYDGKVVDACLQVFKDGYKLPE